MKKTLTFFYLVLLCMVLLFIGGVAFAEVWQPVATIYGWDTNAGRWVKLATSDLDHLHVQTDTNSLVGIYDRTDGEISENDTGANDDEVATQVGVIVNGRMYGFDGTTWDRLRSSTWQHFIVETDTRSLTGIYEDGNTVDVEQGNASGKAATLWGLQTQSNLYAFNGTTFDRLLVDEMDSLIVVTSSLSVTQARNYYYNEVTGGWEMGRSNGQSYQYVETATGSVVAIYDRTDGTTAENDTGGNDAEAVAQIGLITNARQYDFNGTTWDRQQLANWLYGVMRSSDAAKLIEELYGVARSTDMAKLLEELYGVMRSTDAAYMIGQLDDIYNQIKTSVTVSDSRYSNRVSTGTGGRSHVDFSITITNYEMDGFSFYSVGGDTDVTSTWTDGTIYVLEGIPMSEDISIPFENPIFQCDLEAGVTFYYFLNGVQLQ